MPHPAGRLHRRLTLPLVASLTLGLAALPALSVPARAAVTATVGTGTAASCTKAALDSALANAAGGDTIVFSCGPSLVRIIDHLILSKDVAIDGGGLVTISGGGSVYNGTVITVNSGVVATLKGLTISGGIHSNGGGIANSGTLTVASSTLRGNSASVGGGIYNTGTLTITGSTISGNTGAVGGGILNSGTLTVASSTFSGNRVTDSGGGIFTQIGTAAVASSTFVQNRADSNGGAIYTSAPLRIINSTITANSSGSDGSAIYDNGGGTNPVTIAASTINANSSDVSTGGYNGAAIVHTGALSVGTSIVYNNVTGATGTVSECGGASGPSVTDNGYNLSDLDVQGTPATNSCGFTQTTPGTPSLDILVPVGTDIGLGPLGAYGGPFLGALGNAAPTYTERLLPGSPALDRIPVASCVDAAKAPLTTDERGTGFVRPYPAGGLCDIGAFEASVLGSCGLAIAFHALGGTQFALRTGSAANTLMSYLSLKGPAGTITAVPLVPRAGVPSTLSCIVPDPAAVPPSTTNAAIVDALVVGSSNPAIARGSLVRVVAVRTATTETVTVSAINPDHSTGATLYSLTPYVQPQSFVIQIGPPLA